MGNPIISAVLILRPACFVNKLIKGDMETIIHVKYFGVIQ